MEADEAVRPLGGHRLVDDRERRRVRGEHRTVLDDPVELAPHVQLHPEVLGYGLDHEVAVAEVAVVERPLDPAAHGVGVVLLHAALLHGAGELLLDPPDAPVEVLLVDLAHHDVPAGLGRDLRDPMSHQPGAEDAHLRDLH